MIKEPAIHHFRLSMLASSSRFVLQCVAVGVVVATFYTTARSQSTSLFGDGSDGDFTLSPGLKGQLSGPHNRIYNFINVTIPPGCSLLVNAHVMRVSGTLTNHGVIFDSMTTTIGLDEIGTPGVGGHLFHTPPTPGQRQLTSLRATSGYGGSGGGGAWDSPSSRSADGGPGGYGGPGGLHARPVIIWARVLDNQGVIHADGEAGFDGGDGGHGTFMSYLDILFSTRDMASGGGGGGGGGQGGMGSRLEIHYVEIINMGTVRAVAGTGGAGGKGGAGESQSRNSGPTQNEEPGAPATGNGGAGGASETGIAPSQNGTDGLPGSPGADDGAVLLHQVPCCNNLTGNVDCDPNDGCDISDLSLLIDYLYITFSPLCCEDEANTDGLTGIDISDLSALIDYLYISFSPPSMCQ